MVEAILIILIDAGSRSAVMSAVRYETVELCESAKSAVLSNPFTAPGWFRNTEASCIPVVKKDAP